MVVDIIVPVYNVSKYLNKCIESLLAQTYKYIKIILVDDGSTDGSEKICDNCMKCVNGDAAYRAIAIDSIQLEEEYRQGQERKQ